MIGRNRLEDENYPSAEAQERFEKALRGGLNTPPKPLKDIKQGISAKKKQRSKDSNPLR